MAIKSGTDKGEYPSEAPADCSLCPRLVTFRQDNQRKYPDFFNGAVPSFGDEDARILVVGLAPGLKGANRTKRPFTGDYAGDLLYPTLIRFGFAKGTYAARSDDGLALTGCMITNAVRCVPPQNKPTTQEIKTCGPFLASRIKSLGNLKVLFCLGRIAHDSVIATLGKVRAHYPFGHGAVHHIDGLVIVDSYHCSRYNVNTRRLTPTMFEEAFARAVAAL